MCAHVCRVCVCVYVIFITEKLGRFHSRQRLEDLWLDLSSYLFPRHNFKKKLKSFQWIYKWKICKISLENMKEQEKKGKISICELWRNDRKLYMGFLNSESLKSFLFQKTSLTKTP